MHGSDTVMHVHLQLQGPENTTSENTTSVNCRSAEPLVVRPSTAHPSENMQRDLQVVR